jgi:hypothetical protein
MRHRRRPSRGILALSLVWVVAGVAVAACSSPSENGADRTARASIDQLLSLTHKIGAPSFDGISVAVWQSGRQAQAVTTGSPTAISNSPTHASIAICGGQPGCRELVVAVRGSARNCWFARDGVGSTPLPHGAKSGLAYAMTTGQVRCTADEPPTSGWGPSWPNR